MCDLIREDQQIKPVHYYINSQNLGKSLRQTFQKLQNRQTSSISNFRILQQRVHGNQIFLQFQLQLIPLKKSEKTYCPMVVHFDLALQLMNFPKTLNLHARLYEIQLYNQKLPTINSRHRMQISHLIKKFNSSIETPVKVFADQTGKLSFVNLLVLNFKQFNPETVIKNIVKGIGQIIQCISDFVSVTQFFNFLKCDNKNENEKQLSLTQIRLILMESNDLRRQILYKGAQASIKQSLRILFPKLNLIYETYSDQKLQLYTKLKYQKSFLLTQQRRVSKKQIRERLANGILFLQDFPQSQQIDQSIDYQKLIQGGQANIKKVKKKGWIVNTILQIREQHRDSSSSSKRQMQILNQDKIQTYQEFAVKFLRDKNSKSQVQSFINEYNFLRQNANQACGQLAKFYLDINQTKNKVDLPQRSIYMDWQEGDLFNIVYEPILSQKKMFSTQYFMKICEELTFALCFLNYTRICHRDLKMKNILIGNDLSIKLCDFGSCYPIFGQSIERTNKFSPKMRTTFALTYNSQQLPQQVRSMYSRQQYNTHQTFDMYCYGLIIKKLKDSFFIQDKQLKENLDFICQISLEPDPLFRLLPIQILIFLQKLKETYNF